MRQNRLTFGARVCVALAGSLVRLACWLLPRERTRCEGGTLANWDSYRYLTPDERVVYLRRRAGLVEGASRCRARQR